MGHMTQIANKLHIAVESRQEVAAHVQDSHQWQDYFTTRLAPRNEVSPLVSLALLSGAGLPHLVMSSMSMCGHFPSEHPGAPLLNPGHRRQPWIF